jgi:hypothetical protein
MPKRPAATASVITSPRRRRKRLRRSISRPPDVAVIVGRRSLPERLDQVDSRRSLLEVFVEVVL